MDIVNLLLRMTGGLCMFLFGMKMMSDGIQQSAGDRLRKTLNFMTGNRFVGVLTGFVVTSIIQSSHATTLMVVSFVNAGLLTLTQSIGVIMGANIGTTATAWIVSLLGFTIKISDMALPAIGIGFIMSVIKWRYKSLGEFILGFGFLFLGLGFLTEGLNGFKEYFSFNSIAIFNNMGFVSILIGAGAGIVMTFIIHSSSASTVLILSMAYNNIISYEMAASMVLGANIGTTFDAALVTIGANIAARRAALVHVLFNVIGTLWALPLIKPLLALVNVITPGQPVAGDPSITTHLAMLHTVFNVANTIVFLPFVKHYAMLVSLIIRDDGKTLENKHYDFANFSGAITDTPELKIFRAEKEIRAMASVASFMYSRFCEVIKALRETSGREAAVAKLVEELKGREAYADEMREALTYFLIECTREQLSYRSERRVSRLIRIIADLEDMTDVCYSVSLLLEKSVRKDRVFKEKEMDALVPYISLVEEFLMLVKNHLGEKISEEENKRVKEIEADIAQSQSKLHKLGRKRIQAGENLKTELLFIDLVRSIEKLGNYCSDIAKDMAL